MSYIRRELQKRVNQAFETGRKEGLILAGIVGCGKTTLIRKSLEELRAQYQIFEFTGDDVVFRRTVDNDSRFIEQTVRSQTQKKALVFVDEVHKTEQAFDALKYAFDQSDISFIVSGSNPDFLNTTAKKRLQRRADLLLLEPLSLPEILADRNLIPASGVQSFREILAMQDTRQMKEKALFSLTLSGDIQNILDDYWIYGGLPLVYQTEEKEAKLIEIRKVVERGFESFSVRNEAMADTVKVELARLHSREFAYQGIFQRTGVRRRDLINRTIDELVNHAYLIKKQPLLLEPDKRSYLSVFSYTDPGFVTYLTGETGIQKSAGQRVEGMIHARLMTFLKNEIPLKSSLHYFKPYSVDVNGKVKFKPGEIDFVIRIGSRLIPIEVKSQGNLVGMNLNLLRQFVLEQNLPFGIVLYGGVPYWDQKQQIIFWPYWMV